MIRRILYSSLACDRLVTKDVFDIIRQSHNRNCKNGLTGGLLFLDGYFFQVLEGLPHAVQCRYKRIARDPRHTDLVVRQDVTTASPLFSNEWMALRDASQVDPQVLDRHGYMRGMPAEKFTGRQLLEFVLDCFGKNTECLNEEMDPTHPATSASMAPVPIDALQIQPLTAW